MVVGWIVDVVIGVNSGYGSRGALVDVVVVISGCGSRGG